LILMLLLCIVLAVFVKRSRRRARGSVVTRSKSPDPFSIMMNNASFESELPSDAQPHTTHNMAAGLDFRASYLETVDNDDDDDDGDGEGRRGVRETDIDKKLQEGRTASVVSGAPLRQMFLPSTLKAEEAKLELRSVFDAIDEGDVATLKKVLEEGMSPHGDPAEYGNYGHTPLQLAVLTNQPVMCELLLGYGKKVKPTTAQRHAAKKLSPLPPLHLVANTDGSVSVIEPLVNGGLNINGRDGSGKTALHVAVAKGNMAVVTELLRLGANVRATDVKTGCTPLHLAATAGDADMVQLLAWNSLRAVNQVRDAQSRTRTHTHTRAHTHTHTRVHAHTHAHTRTHTRTHTHHHHHHHHHTTTARQHHCNRHRLTSSSTDTTDYHLLTHKYSTHTCL
jgi:hypothetical protein